MTHRYCPESAIGQLGMTAGVKKQDGLFQIF